MTQEQQALLMVKGLISELTDNEQAKVREAYNEIIMTVHKYGDAGTLAMALLGTELSAAG